MVNTKNRYINNFDFDIKTYHNIKHKYEPNSICEMPVKWSKAKDFNVYDDKGNKWIDMTSGIFVTNAGHSNPAINDAIKKQVDKYMPFIKINNIIFDKGLAPEDSDQSLVLSIIIDYEVPSLNFNSDLTLYAEEIA